MEYGVPDPSRLIAGEAELRMLLDSVPARVALLDRNRRHWYVNQDYARFVGRPMEEILGRTVQDIVGTGPYAELQPLGAKALAGEVVHWQGWMPHHQTKEPLFVQRFYVPYRAACGAVEGYFILTRDLTELKRTEQRLAEQVAALHASQALAEAITTAALDSVIVVDEAGAVVSFNPAAEATFGYSKAFAIGKPIADLIIPRGVASGTRCILAAIPHDRRGTMARSACRDASNAFGWHYISGGTGSLRGEAAGASHARDLSP